MARLSDPKAFAALATSRHRARTGGVRVTWVPGQTDEPARVAFAIGRRVGGAVVRNRLRRRLRAIVVDAAPPPGAYLVSAAPEAALLPFPELKAQVTKALQATTRSTEPA